METLEGKQRTKNFDEIKKTREKQRQMKRLKRKIVATIVTVKGDNRGVCKLFRERLLEFIGRSGNQDNEAIGAEGSPGQW